MSTAITIHDLTIRQLKALGRNASVPGFSKMTSGELITAIQGVLGGEREVQEVVDALLAPEAKTNGKGAVVEQAELTEEQREEAKLEALRDIAKASTARMRAEDELRSRRLELNQEVQEAKASHQGAMERDVDYKEPKSVSAKLKAITEAWTTWKDAEEHRREELAPLKEKLSAARTREREAFDNVKQLKIKF